MAPLRITELDNKWTLLEMSDGSIILDNPEDRRQAHLPPQAIRRLKAMLNAPRPREA